MKIILFDMATSGHHVKYASHLARYLSEQGDEVKFVTWTTDEHSDSVLGQISGCSTESLAPLRTRNDVRTKPLRWSHHLQGVRRCLDIAERWSADVVHDLYLDRKELYIYLNTLFRKQPHSRLFGTFFWPYFVHTSDEQVALHKRLYHQMNRRILAQLLRQTTLSGLFVHTQDIKEKLTASFGDRHIHQNIFVVPDPAEQLESIDQRLAREQLSLPQDKPVILFFGGLRRDKGPHILLKALPFLDQENVCVVIAGKPGYIGPADVESYMRKLPPGVRLKTQFEFVSEEDMARYYAASDAVILPYTSEFIGTSGVLQTATAAGKPVIAADVGQVGPAVREYGLGILVEPESPASLATGIRKFLGIPEDRKEEFASHALEYASANDWRVTAGKVRNAYQSVASK